jgi:hypothetical protein
MEYWSIGVMGPKPNTPSLQYRITPTRWSDVRGTRRENPWEEIYVKIQREYGDQNDSAA